MLGKALDSSCIDCSLNASSKHVCIGGRGSKQANIFLIGEAPGSAEAATGKPFMGRAGQLLNQLVIEIGIEDDVFISNVCRCRPPENRKPTDDEIKACQPYLVHELHQVNPKAIVLMGKTAMRFVELTNFYEGTISAGTKPFRCVDLHGLKSVFIIPSWHPAYCLRRGEGATNDLRRALLWAKRKTR